MQVKVKLDRLLPEPQDQATSRDRLELAENPAFLLILARLRRKAVMDSFSNDDGQLLQKAREAQGVQSALEVIDRVLHPAGERNEEE